MIQFDHIHKAFGKQVVLEDVGGRFERGQMNLVIGASGMGKSVLLKCIVGLLPMQKGSVSFDGHPFHYRAKHVKDIRRRIGMLFQSVALFDSKTVEENVRFPLDILTQTPMSEKTDRVNVCLERVGLAGTNRKMPSELSGGMKKRVGIARAIAGQCEYLFCDEPNSGLDPQMAIRIDNLIKEITLEFNITTIVITHDMNSVMEIGDLVLFIHQGKKRWEGKGQDILHADEPFLREFLFSSQLMKALQRYTKKR